jgi:serine/threonine-protein kinase
MSQKMIGRYEIVNELGRGGMATVYLAYDPTLEREVALKLLPNYFAHDPEFSARFEREAKTVAALEHNAIVSMYDYGEDGEWPYFVMRLMKGGSLKERIEKGTMALSEAVEIVRRVAGALDKAHARGIVHRDLKPGNIMFDEDGEAYLGDFGIVKLAASSESYTRTGNTLGTPAYMSPEQADGRPDIDGRSDVYGLGIILYEMLAGTAPFVHESMPRLLVMHLTQPIPNILEARPELPAALQSVIDKALAKERDDRYATASELAEATMAVLDGKAMPAGATAPAQVVVPGPVSAEAEAPAMIPPEPGPVAAAAAPEPAAASQPEPVSATTPTPVTATVEVPERKQESVTPSPPATAPSVEKPAGAKGGFPKWAFAVIGVVVVGIIGGVIALSSGGGDSTPEVVAPESSEFDDSTDRVSAPSFDAGDSAQVDVAPDSGDFEDGSFFFGNEGDSAVCSLFVAPSAEEDWGDDWLGGAPLFPGEAYEFVGESGLYDFFAISCDDEIVLEEFQIELLAGTAIEIPMFFATGASESAEDFAVIVFINETGGDICWLYAIPSVGDFEENIIELYGLEAMAAGETLEYEVEANVDHDILAYDCDGAPISEEVGLSFEPNIVIEWILQ